MMLKAMPNQPFFTNTIMYLAAKYDCIIYFSRLGDLKRFENIHSCKVVMSYARNINMLASKFGTTNYKIHLDFKVGWGLG